MRIVVGVKTYDEADWFLAHGAAEVYGSVRGLPNHREEDQCIRTDKEFLRIARLARQRGKKAILALNQACFEKDFKDIARRAKSLVRGGVAGVVVAELPLLHHLIASDLKTCFILSSLSLMFNSRTLGYYRSLGIKRIVLPFQLAPREAGRIIRNPHGLETEVFFHSDFCCVNMDPACRLDGWVKRYQVCRFQYASGGTPFRMPGPAVPQQLDAVYDFFRAGVQYLKIVRRQSFNEEAEIFKQALVTLALLEKGVNRADFARMGEALYFSVSRNRQGRDIQ
jgi:hypothetical protein